MYKYLFWDLDGTLTDSSEGITKCALLVLEHFGIEGYTANQLLKFIGPPLRQSFLNFGISEDSIDAAIAVYRGRYNEVGKFENKPYDGIKELLEKLQKEGFHHFLATSKPKYLADQILEKYELSQYFDIICGASEDEKICNKEDVILFLLGEIEKKQPVSPAIKNWRNQIVMIGDTTYDVTGAKVHDIPCIVVSWGFGNIEEMKEAGAIGVAHTMQELHSLLL